MPEGIVGVPDKSPYAPEVATVASDGVPVKDPYVASNGTLMVISSVVGSVAVIPAPVNVNLVAPVVNVVDSSITVIDDPPPPVPEPISV